MKKAERLVSFYDLKITAAARNFPAPKTISVRRAFELMEMVPVDQRFKEYAKGLEHLYISDWKREGDVISILMSKSDKTISDPVFTVPLEGTRRTAEKQAKEGQDFSVHMVVKLPADDAVSALFIIEYCAGMGIFVVQLLLNQILMDAKKLAPDDFQQFHPDGALDENLKPKKLNVNFKCRFDGHLSDDLKNDLNNGKVQSIELITEKTQHTAFDEDGYITEKCKTVVLSLKDEENPVQDKFNRIVGMFKKNENEYAKAKIKFKSPEGVDRTVDMNTHDGLAQAYVRKAKLEGFQIELASSYEKFCEPIIDKMKALIQ